MTSAATWHVTFDPAQPEDRIGAVAAQAASGDSILIDPGTYYEHIALEGKSLTFVGSEGAGVTVLDGSREFPGREGSIIYTLTGVPANLALEGLTLRNGTGAPWVHEFNAIGGGAVFWWQEGFDLTARLLVSDCVFQDNSTGGAENGWAIGGGAAFAVGLRDVRFERCSFSNNASNTMGGDIYLAVNGGSVIAQCSFGITYGSWNGGSSIDVETGETLTIQECRFESMVSGGWGSAFSIGAEAFRIEIVGSQFIDHETQLATRLDLGYSGMGNPRQDVVVSRNLFWSESGPDTAAGLVIAMPGGAFDINENTFVRCGVDVQNHGGGGGAPMNFANNIVAHGEVKFFIASGGVVACNDFWRTAITDYIGNLTLSDNISGDPLFCSEEAEDLRIAFQSPCAAENSPAGCGRIGAFDPACHITPTRQLSWGSIKAFFRGER
jgi:hypothetical protein